VKVTLKFFINKVALWTEKDLSDFQCNRKLKYDIVILIFVYICPVIETSSIISFSITVMLFTYFLNNFTLPLF
jgi:hypothetical protein